MALMSSRAAPDSASARRFSTMSVAGCLSLIHSKIGHESRTRVFKFALLFSELQEIFLYVPTSAPELPPGSALGKHNFLATHFEGQLRALAEIESVPNLLRYRDLPLGGHRNLIHRCILPCVRLIATGTCGLIHTMDAALLSISPFTRSTNASTLADPSALSCPRTRTLTSPASISLSPTTSWNGTFCMACSRILAFIFSLRTSTCTRTPAALSFSPTSLAYAWCFSPMGTTTTCTGDSHTGNVPA